MNMYRNINYLKYSTGFQLLSGRLYVNKMFYFILIWILSLCSQLVTLRY